MIATKSFESPNYNFVFSTQDGLFARWGKTFGDDPEWSPYGPELADFEVSTVCHRTCRWCYKSNNKDGRNMTFLTFKAIFDRIPKHLTQVAIGIGDIDANPDLWNMMEYCRLNDVVPNITINGERMNPRYYDLLVSLCGAVAVKIGRAHV